MTELEQLRAENRALREAIDKIANHDWIVQSWYDPTRVGEEWHWRVNVRNEPAVTRRGGTQTYRATSFVGRTPADAALAALSADIRSRRKGA